MQKNILIALCLTLLTAFQSAADPRENAAYLIDRDIIASYAERLEITARDFIEAVDTHLTEYDAHIIDHDFFAEALIGDYFVNQKTALVDASVEAYLEILTSEEIEVLATYYRAIEEKEPTASEQVEIDKAIANLTAINTSLQAKNPKLRAALKAGEAEAHAANRAQFSAERIAGLLDDPRLVAFKDEDKRTRLVADMRGHD